MKRLSTSLLGVTLLLCLAGSAWAADKYPPGPAYRSCPDSVTMYSIQQTDTTLAPCHPAVLDTVLGVGGIIIGFDAKASAYGFYMENSPGAPRTGIDVFTGATNYNGPVVGTPSGGNLAIGDSVIVYGRTQEFPNPNGETELEGFDGVQSTNDIIIRRISTGNPLPPVKILTTSQINWIPTAPGNLGEEYEGMLVRVRGPLKVARTLNVLGLFTGSFLMVSVASPTDSIMIDGATLTTFSAPAVGTIVDSIQGIVNQRTTSAVNSYRIQIRDGNDVFLAAPPNMVDAYPIEDNIIRVQFDRNVDLATAQTPGNYSLASAIDGSTVDAAVVEGGSGPFVQLTITSVRVDGDIETVSGVNIGAATCPTCLMSPQQSRTFVNGVLDIEQIERADPANLPLFDDRSRFAGTGTLPGTKLSFRGVGTGAYGSLYYMQTENSGAPSGPLRSGVSVFGPTQPLTQGRKYLVAGQVQEFGGETEVVSTVYIKDEGVGTLNPPLLGDIRAVKDTTTDQTGTNLTGEDYEGMLVKLDHVWITENRTVGQSFFVTGHCCNQFTGPGSGDTLLVSNLNGALNTYDSPDSMTVMDITGVVHITGGTFRVCPRSSADIVEYGLLTGVEGGSNIALALKVSPNPGRLANVTFAVPRKALVDISVFDLAGRKVATVAKGVFEPGSYTRRWEAIGADGKRVPAGVYFYSYRVGGQELKTRSIVLN